jgi:hypothetical protein
MTFIPEELGIKSSNQDNFLKHFQPPPALKSLDKGGFSSGNFNTGCG